MRKLNKKGHGSPISMAAAAIVILMGVLLIRLSLSPFPNQDLLLLIGLVLIASAVATLL